MRRSTLRLFVASWFLVACSQPPKKDDDTNRCDCSSRVCGLLCGKVCGTCPNDGVCSADGLSCRASLDIGAACQTDNDCGLNRVCLSSASGVQAPNGYCSKPCSVSVACPTGSTCALDSKGDDVCMAQCPVTSGGGAVCREADGYTCSAQNICRACVPDCTGKTCGDDGCGGACGMLDPMTPACQAPGELCSSHDCASAYVKNSLPGNAFANGLMDSIALERNGQAVIIGGREVAQFTGGFQASTRGIKEIEVIDPMTGTLSSTHYTPLPVAIARPHAAFYDGRLYVAGGIADPNVPEGESGSEDTILVEPSAANPHPIYYYNDNANWARGAEIPHPSMGGGLAAAGDALYLVVGQTADGQPSALFDAYDPAANEWNNASSNQVAPPDRPTARSYAGVIGDGNRIYVVGGYDGTQAVGTVEIFDPAKGWSTSTPLPKPVADPKVAIASGRIFVFGGRLSPGLRDDAVSYVQSIDLTTHATRMLGKTYGDRVGQTPIGLRTSFLIFGGIEVSVSNDFVANRDLLTFTVPAP